MGKLEDLERRKIRVEKELERYEKQLHALKLKVLGHRKNLETIEAQLLSEVLVKNNISMKDLFDNMPSIVSNLHQTPSQQTVKSEKIKNKENMEDNT